MKNIKSLLLTLALGGAFFSCTYTPPEPAEDPTNPRIPPVAGSADFSKYVAIGNSLTAGFMDNALYEEGQKNSFAVILGERMKLVNGGAAFNVPILASPTGAGFGGFAPGTNPPVPVGRFRFVLPTCAANPAATPTLGMTPAPTVPGDALTPFSGDKATLNNFGVPGAKSFHSTVNGYGASPALGNPFYWRFASGQAASLLGDAVAARGTFFTYWLGNNDVLSYATSGGSGNPNPGLNPANYGSNDMTDPVVFRAVLSSSITAMLSTSPNTKGVIATIPDVVRTPYFQTINATLTAGGTNATLPFALRQGQADTLNFIYSLRGTQAAAVRFRAGKVNYPVIATAAGLRHMNPTQDFLVLTIPQDNLLVGQISACNLNQRAGWGITTEIPNNFVLDATEVQAVNARVAAFNDIIRAEAATRNDRIAVADMYALLRELTPARNNVGPGGYFSLDGVHPNPRGHALIANAFIRTINAKWGSTLPPVDIMDYRQNILPTTP